MMTLPRIGSSPWYLYLWQTHFWCFLLLFCCFLRKPQLHAFKLVLKRKGKKTIGIIVDENLSMLVLSYSRVPLVHMMLVHVLRHGNNVLFYFILDVIQLIFKYQLGAYIARTLRARLLKSRNHTIPIYYFHTKMTCEWLTDHLHVGSHPIFLFFSFFPSSTLKHVNVLDVQIQHKISIPSFRTQRTTLNAFTMFRGPWLRFYNNIEGSKYLVRLNLNLRACLLLSV